MLSLYLIFEKEVLHSCPQLTAVRNTRQNVIFLPCLTANARNSPGLFCHLQFLLSSFCGDSSVSANRQVKIKPSLSQFPVPLQKRPCLSHRHVTRRFDPSCNTIYIVSKSFLRVLKSSKKRRKYDVMYQTLYRIYKDTDRPSKEEEVSNPNSDIQYLVMQMSKK